MFTGWRSQREGGLLFKTKNPSQSQMENLATTNNVTELEIQALATNAPIALAQNKQSIENLEAKGRELIELAKAGMTPELDAAMNEFLVKCNVTKKNLNDRRSPLTKFLNDIISEFTSLENAADKAKTGTIPSEIQRIRNDYAKACAEAERKAQAELELKKQQDAERINLKSRIIGIIRQNFDFIYSAKIKTLTSFFTELTLENFEENEKQIRSFNEVLYDFVAGFEVQGLGAFYIDKSEFPTIIEAAKVGLYDAYYAEFKEGIQNKKQEIISQLSGKRLALEEAKAAAEQLAKAQNESERLAAIEQQARLEAEAEQRKLDQEKADKEAADKRALAAAAMIEQEKQVEVAESLFENEMISQEAVPASTAQVRTGYIIEVQTPHGWMLIFQKWFELEGSKMDLSKFEKKTLGSIKTVCEKHAHKTGERIDSKLIKYTEDFNVVAKR